MKILNTLGVAVGAVAGVCIHHLIHKDETEKLKQQVKAGEEREYTLWQKYLAQLNKVEELRRNKNGTNNR